jgi:ATP-binding cassette subfamily A (ABC1) protein 2
MESRTKSIETITQFISKRIHGASLTRQINNTLTFTLPYAQKTNFEDFFIALERNKNSLDIASYGISDTTLEEVFILILSMLISKF